MTTLSLSLYTFSDRVSEAVVREHMLSRSLFSLAARTPSPTTARRLASAGLVQLRTMASSATQAGPVETAIREKVSPQSRAEPSRASRASFSPEARELTPSSVNRQLTATLAPSVLEISNDSAAHRHHAPMRAVGGGSGETHFSVHVVSDKFQGLVRMRLVFRVASSLSRPAGADMKKTRSA